MPPIKEQDFMVVETRWGWVGVGFSEAGLVSSSLPQESRDQVVKGCRPTVMGEESDYRPAPGSGGLLCRQEGGFSQIRN